MKRILAFRVQSIGFRVRILHTWLNEHRGPKIDPQRVGFLHNNKDPKKVA